MFKQALGAGIGALSAAFLSFIAGLFLPVWLAPSSNIGPITAFVVTPIGFAFGGILGLVVVKLTSSPLGAIIVGAIAGASLVIGLSLITGAGIKSVPDVISIVAASLIFGISALLSLLASRSKKEK